MAENKQQLTESQVKVNNDITHAITGNSIQSAVTTNLNNSISLSSLVNSTTSTTEALSSLTSEVQQSEALSETKAGNQSATLSSMYRSGRGRLVEFSYADGSDDDERRAYMKLQGNTTAMQSLIEGEDKSLLEAVYTHLIDGYTSVIILSMQENLQERQSVMPTVGDSFAATFSGQQPQVLVITGYLPLDGNKDNSWFHAFVNAYKYFIRASKLAKYHCSLRIVFPDFASYTCYPVSFSSSLDSQSDTLVSFSLTAVVTSNPINKGYGYSASITAPANTVEEVAQATSDKTVRTEIENGVTKSPAEVGEVENKKNWVSTVTDFVNGAMNSKTMQTVNKVFAVADQVSGAVSAVSGTAYGTRNVSGKVGRGSYI